MNAATWTSDSLSPDSLEACDCTYSHCDLASWQSILHCIPSQDRQKGNTSELLICLHYCVIRGTSSWFCCYLGLSAVPSSLKVKQKWVTPVISVTTRVIRSTTVSMAWVLTIAKQVWGEKLVQVNGTHSGDIYPVGCHCSAQKQRWQSDRRSIYKDPAACTGCLYAAGCKPIQHGVANCLNHFWFESPRMHLIFKSAYTWRNGFKTSLNTSVKLSRGVTQHPVSGFKSQTLFRLCPTLACLSVKGLVITQQAVEHTQIIYGICVDAAVISNIWLTQILSNS